MRQATSQRKMAPARRRARSHCAARHFCL